MVTASRVNRDTVSTIKGRVPLHLSSSVGDSNGTHHCYEKGSHAEKLVVELYAPNGSTTIGVPKVSSTSSRQVMGSVYSSNDGRTCGAKFSMASHASSPLNSPRFPSAAKSRSIQVHLDVVGTP
ncbi:hypothetical protein Tco_0787604, partial [Tanacetum coccineum]